MLNRLAASAIGTSDRAHVIPKSEWGQTQDALSFLVEQETPYVVLRAPQDEHIFTDLAYVKIWRDDAIGTKRYVSRYEYSMEIISSPVFVTAGLGMSMTQDCHIEFRIGGQAAEIKIAQSSVEGAKLLYKLLITLARAQSQNAKLYEALHKSIGGVNGLIKESDTEGFVNVLKANTISIFNQYQPISYKYVFEDVYKGSV